MCFFLLLFVMHWQNFLEKFFRNTLYTMFTWNNDNSNIKIQRLICEKNASFIFIQYYHVQNFLTLNLILQLYFFTSKDYILSIGKFLSNIDRNETKKIFNKRKKNIQNKTSSNRFFQFHLRSQFYGAPIEVQPFYFDHKKIYG